MGLHSLDYFILISTIIPYIHIIGVCFCEYWQCCKQEYFVVANIKERLTRKIRGLKEYTPGTNSCPEKKQARMNK